MQVRVDVDCVVGWKGVGEDKRQDTLSLQRSFVWMGSIFMADMADVEVSGGMSMAVHRRGTLAVLRVGALCSTESDGAKNPTRSPNGF